MRVNMDSSIAFDPRFKIGAAKLGIKKNEFVGGCFHLWLHCYQSRSERLANAEANASAEIDNMAQTLVDVGLADADGADYIIVHGVRERIKFLIQQSRRGRKGGKTPKKPAKTDGSERLANAKRTLKENIATAKAYSPAPSPALTPAPPLVLREEPPPENRNGIQLHETSFVPMPFADRFKAIVKRYPDKKPSVRAEAHWKLVATDEEAVAKIEAGLDAWVLCDQWFDGIGIPSLSNFLEERWFDNLPARKAKAKTVAERIDEIAAEQERNRAK